MPTDFRLIDLARLLVAEIDDLIDTSHLIESRQLREAAHSIPANIREAYGRRDGPERKQFLRYARGSAEETDERVRSNCTARRLPQSRYWRIRNRVAVMNKMLDRLL